MGKREQIWESFKNREYRDCFAQDLGLTLAIQIRRLREKRGLTQRELGELVGVKRGTITRIENPDNEYPSLRVLAKLANVFDVAFMLQLISFSELLESMVSITPERLMSPSFEEDK